MPYYLHQPSGRYVQSQSELEIANFLHVNNTPFYCGLDAETFVGLGMRSVDFVIPAIAGRHGRVYVEYAGLWHYPDERRRTEYRNGKFLVQQHLESLGEVYIRIDPVPPSNVPSRNSLMEYLGEYLGGAEEIELHPPRVPASTIDGASGILAHIGEYFEEGDEISTAILDEHPMIGGNPTNRPSAFVVRMYQFFPDGIRELAEAGNYYLASSEWGPTLEEFEERLMEHFDPYVDIPSSEWLRNNDYSWVVSQADIHYSEGYEYRGYRALRERFGLEQIRRVPYTLQEILTFLHGLDHPEGICPSSGDISDANYSIYVRIQQLSRDLGFTSPQMYISHLMGLEPNNTIYPMASEAELIQWLTEHSEDGILPNLSLNYNAEFTSPLLRRLGQISIDRSWGKIGLPLAAQRLTGLKARTIVWDDESRAFDLSPLELLVEDLARAVQQHGRDTVRGWAPGQLIQEEKRIYNILSVISNQREIPIKVLWFDVLMVPWTERRTGRGEVRALQNWRCFCKDIRERYPEGNVHGSERKMYGGQFRKYHNDRAENLAEAITLAISESVNGWFLSHPFFERIWDTENPHDEYLATLHPNYSDQA